MSEEKLKIIVLSTDDLFREKVVDILKRRESLINFLDARDVEDIKNYKPLKDDDIIIWSTKNTLSEIKTWHKGLGINCRLVCCIDTIPAREELKVFNDLKIKFITTPIRSIELCSIVHDLMEEYSDKQDIKDREHPHNMIPIQSELLQMWTDGCPFNVYLKISDKKYVMIISNGIEDYFDIFDKYKRKGVHDFYIIHADYAELKEKLIHGPKESKSSPEVHLKNVNIFLQKMLLSSGISQESIKLAESLTGQVLDSFDANDSIKSLFINDLFQKNNQFCYNHSYLTALVCTQIGQKLQWNSQTIIHKLVMASLLHDSSLDTPELIVMHDLYPEELSGLEKDDKEDILHHGPTLANILLQHISVDSDTISIIKNSHEKPNGNGYPRGLNTQKLSSQAGVFLLSHDFVIEFYKSDFNINAINEITISLYDKYNHGNFEKIAKAFKEIFYNDEKLFVA